MAKLYWTDDKIRETVRYTLEVEQGLKIEEIPSVVSKLYLIYVGFRKQLCRFKDSPVNLLKFVYPNTFSEEQFKTRRNSPAIYAKNKKDNTSNKNDDIWR